MDTNQHKDVNLKCLAFALRKASRIVSQLYDRAFITLDIRSTQFNLLVGMSCNQAKTLTELALWLAMDRTTLTRNLKPLERAQLITAASTRDKRSKAYTLTEKGQQLVHKTHTIWLEVQQKIDSCLRHEERSHMISLLGDLMNRIRDLT